jgi:hypothetical protein
VPQPGVKCKFADDLDEESALRKADLPALVKMGVENLLATRIPLAG